MGEKGDPVHHHGTAAQVVTRRVAAVVDRLDVAMQFTAVDTWVAAQVLHAVEFAQVGPSNRDDARDAIQRQG